MNVKEVAGLLAYSDEQVKWFVSTGHKLPMTGTMVKLESTEIRGRIDVSDERLNAVIRRFENEEPSRYPPFLGHRIIALIEVLVQRGFRIGPNAEVVHLAADFHRPSNVRTRGQGKLRIGLLPACCAPAWRVIW